MGQEHLFGWHEAPAEVERIVCSLERPIFSLAATSDVLDDKPRSVWFWDAEEYLFGRTLAAHAQGTGDCVSQGWGRGVQDLLLMALAAARQAGRRTNERFYQVATEGLYALSRVEVGRRQLGRGAGSVGAWAAKAVQQYGVLARRLYPSEGFDLTNYSASRADDWGWDGLPDNLEDDAKLTPVRTVSLVTSGDALRVALQNRFPVPICSGQGFREVREPETGICRPFGTWAHCMLARGFLILKGNRWVIPTQQSWGNNPTGPARITLETGQEIDLPQGVFNVDMEVAERMVARWQDSFAVSAAAGFARSTV